ncbi:hypothetical protein IKF94_03580 [Candidatus Saccharibacteria bacterium]|nr:hypothetical protein [Candidatus Saccharibacteria bacterium]
MRGSGENYSVNNADNVNAVDNSQEAERPRSLFKRIGNKINAAIQNRNEQRREIETLARIAEIERLAQSDDESDRKRLRGLLNFVDVSDDRVLEAVLNSYDTFNESQLYYGLVIGKGVEKEKILKNKHVRDLAVSHFTGFLKSDDSPDGSHIRLSPHSPGEQLVDDSVHSEETLLQTILEDVINDEDTRKKIIKDVGEDAINRCGDEACEAAAFSYIVDDEKRMERIKRKVGLLKRLGYDYFSSEDEREREEKVSGLFGRDTKCHVLDQLGFMNSGVVSAMYRIKAQKMAEYSKGDDDEDGRSDQLVDNRRSLKEAYSIPDWLEPEKDDEIAQYWREQDKKCGFDAMVVVASSIRRGSGSRRLFGDAELTFWSDKLTPNEELFNNSEIGSPLYDLKFMFYRPGSDRGDEYDADLMAFFANNLDKIEDCNMRGFIANWAKIQCETEKETAAARLAYLKYMAQGSDRFASEWNAETEQWEDIKFFDEDGNPTAAFFDYGRIARCNPKKFLPFIDEKWKNHYTDKQLIGIDFGEEFPDFRYWDSTGCKSEEDFLEMLDGHSKACKGLAAFTKISSYKLDYVAEQITTDNIDEYFDENGPKPTFWQKALEKKSFDFLMSQPEKIRQNFGFDATTQRFIELYRRYGAAKLPNFILAEHTYIDENGETKTESWTKNIPEYFDENGPKPEFIKKCLINGEFDAFGIADEETIKKSDLDDLSMQFVLAVGNHASINFPLDSSNIIMAFTKFLKMDADDWYLATENDLKIREAFADNETKNLALEYLKKEYEHYLHSGEEAEFPIGLAALSSYMHQQDGAGPLVQIEAFLDFAGALNSAGDKGKTLTAAIEDRIKKDRWDNQDKTNFYAVSAEVIQASPEIYHEFAELFANIKDKKDFETFTKEIYPLYRAKLALLRDYNESSYGIGHGFSTVNYKSVDKEALRDQLHNALLPFNLQELSPDKRREGIGRVREIILGEITDLFHTKLGIRPEAIPEEFGKSDIRLIEDMTLYLSNVAMPTSLKKNLIGLFLALRLGKSDGWDKLRMGEEINPDGYLEVDSSERSALQAAVLLSRANNPVNQENTRISDTERLRKFRSALQGEVSTMHIGNTQTIDQRLQNLISNIEDLTDPDLYPDEIDKKKIAILERYSPKSVGSVAAKMWQRANGRDIRLSDEEGAIADDLAELMKDQGASMTPENIKTYLQDGFNAIKMPFNIRQVVEDSHAIEAISELQRSLTPPDDVAHIFGKLGEEFQPKSGVLAVGADLDYLENLIVKHEDQLTEDEKAVVKEYIGTIRAKMSELEKIYDKIAQSFEKFEKSVHGTEADQLHTEIAEVSGIVHGINSQTVVTTTCTNSMTTIIENMRACLSGKTKGINNDTDLTFGESYKFYLYSSNGTSTEGSTSDEIVYFVPSEHDGGRSMSFVMDQIYGRKNSDIFMSHVGTIIKKASELKKQFPEVPITVFIPNTTTASCSVTVSAEELAARIEFPTGATVLDVTDGSFNIPASGFGDHYIEFGGKGARTPGERQASGIEIVL